MRLPPGRALIVFGASAVAGLGLDLPGRSGLADAGGIAAAEASAHSCGSLKGRSLLRSPVLKVVERGGPAGAVVYVCVRPHGRVRRAGRPLMTVPWTRCMRSR